MLDQGQRGIVQAFIRQRQLRPPTHITSWEDLGEQPRQSRTPNERGCWRRDRSLVGVRFSWYPANFVEQIENAASELGGERFLGIAGRCDEIR